MITPAISVLGAVEGLEVDRAGAAAIRRARSTLVIIVVLFAIQKHGTAQHRRAVRTGDVRVVRACSRLLGADRDRCATPAVLAALNPRYALRFFADDAACRLPLARRGGARGDRHRGAVRRHGPLRRARRSAARGSFFVLPALVLNYFGQGALLLADPAAIKNPFYLLAPAWALVPLVVLATVRDRHRVAGRHLRRVLADARGDPDGLLPAPARSSTRPSAQIGQIYVPFINWSLLVAVIAAGRRLPELGQPRRRLRHRGHAGDDDRLDPDLRRDAQAVELAAVRSRSRSRRRCCSSTSRSSRRTRSRSPKAAGSRCVIGGIVFTLLTTWKRGRALLMRPARRRTRMPLDVFIQSIEAVAADARAGHGGVPDVDAEPRAARAAAQPEAQQGAARARRVPHASSPATSRSCADEDRIEIKSLGCDFYQFDRVLRLQGGSRRAGAARGLRPPAASPST